MSSISFGVKLSLVLAVSAVWCTGAFGEPLRLRLRDQVAASPATAKEGHGEFHTRIREAEWDPRTTAVIICDVWDYHHCRRAVDRLAEFGPRLNEVVRRARELGAVVIHAPSDCMPAYAEHPARVRATSVPRCNHLPKDVELWCSLVPAEHKARYPIDQSDGGEDDDPAEHAEWAAKLKALGRNPAMPWQKQSDLIEIDRATDYISDRGDEVWNILEARGVRHVILAGVHANMCVLGRPFGLRRMVLGGKEVVLMRDMTDTMYDSTSWPYVSHFTANDRIVDHVERYVCPTITSDQLLGSKPFRFAADKRPHLVIVAAEEGYGTKETLTRFADDQLGRDFRVSFVYGQSGDAQSLPGLEVLDEADLALFSVRRHVLKPEQMAIIRRFVAAGKPVLGLRTASHAFALAPGTPTPAGYEAWPEFDVDVFGARYLEHAKTKSDATLRPAPGAADDPILRGTTQTPQRRPGGLYRFEAMTPQVKLLVEAEQDGERRPIAWTFTRADGGRSFYTSLGERADFEHPDFMRMLLNAVYWGAGLPEPAVPTKPSARESLERHWSLVAVPGPLEPETKRALDGYSGPVWYRVVVRIPDDLNDDPVELRLPQTVAGDVWWNGHRLTQSPRKQSDGSDPTVYVVNREITSPGDAALIVVRRGAGGEPGFSSAPSLQLRAGESPVSLAGRWQMRIGDDPTWSNMPLPAKFGTPTDIVIDPMLENVSQ